MVGYEHPQTNALSLENRSFVFYAPWNAWKGLLKPLAPPKIHYPHLTVYFEKAYGYAVFPTITKGGIGIGAAHGTGEVYEKGEYIGTASMTQVTVGAQFGGQTYSEIVFFKDKETLEDFKKGNFKPGAQASTIASTAGASTDADYDHGVAIFTLSKSGLMFEATAGGQKFNFKPK